MCDVSAGVFSATLCHSIAVLVGTVPTLIEHNAIMTDMSCVPLATCAERDVCVCMCVHVCAWPSPPALLSACNVG